MILEQYLCYELWAMSVLNIFEFVHRSTSHIRVQSLIAITVRMNANELFVSFEYDTYANTNTHKLVPSQHWQAITACLLKQNKKKK